MKRKSLLLIVMSLLAFVGTVNAQMHFPKSAPKKVQRDLMKQIEQNNTSFLLNPYAQKSFSNLQNNVIQDRGMNVIWTNSMETGELSDWWTYEFDGNEDQFGFYNVSSYAYDGNNFALSYSVGEDESGNAYQYEPYDELDNLLFTPDITLPNVDNLYLSFYARAMNTNTEYFYVVSLDSDSNINPIDSDATYYTISGTTYQEFVFDISALKGQTIAFGVEHVYGGGALLVDYFRVYQETDDQGGDCEDFESYASSASNNISYNNGSVPSGWSVSGNTGNYRPHFYNGTYSRDGVGIVFTSGSNGGNNSYLYSNITLHEGDEVSFNTFRQDNNGTMYYGYWRNNAFQNLGTATAVNYSGANATQGVTTFTVPAAADGYPLAWRWYYNSTRNSRSAVIDNVCVTPAASCDYTIPYAYGFEDASDFNCWTKVNCETCSSNSNMYGLYNSSNYAHSGSKLFIFSSYCGETDPQYLISPELTGVVNGVHVEFYYENCNFSSAPETFQVGYSTTDNNVNSFTWVDSKSNTAQTYQHFTANYMGQVKYVAVKYTSADSYYLYLDDFLFEEAPSCLEPTNIVASNETTTSATISWTAGGSETEWDLYYTTNPSDVPSASTAPSISSITTNSQNLTGLNPASTYYVYLRSVCGGSESSAWSVPGIFNTECYAMTLPYSYGFEDGALSVCWTPIIGNPVYMSIEVSDADPRTGTYHLNLDRRTPDGIQIIVLPEVDGAYALNNCEVSFYAKLSAGGSSNYTTTGRTLAVGVMTDPNDASTFVQVGNAVTPTASYAKYTFDLSSYTGNGQYIAIKHDESSSGNNGYTYIDDLEVTTAAIPVSSITADPVTVTVGQTANITGLEVLPADATNTAVTYTSNNTGIASVTDAGVVTGVAVGTTTITIAATDGSGTTGTINVTVNGIDVTEITASDVTVVNGETATISYTVAPDNATDPSVTFTSASDAIATVDANGVVTGHAVGTTTITITSVSNPEVTAEITVTVTSNPNAVQFTVTAPANAQPGDVITVDFMLAAPTTGTYTGFTGLDVNLYFDNTAFQYNSKANGAVADAVSDIDMGQVSISGPNTNNPNRVKAILSTPANHPVTAEGIVFSATFTVLQDVALGSYTFNAEINEFDYTTGEIGNSNTVDIPYEFTPSTVTIAEQYTLPIIGYDTEAAHGTLSWYLIASPIGTIANDNLEEKVTNIFSYSYDLYYFNQSGKQGDDYVEWINYKPGNGTYQATDYYFDLVRGKGYLYANSQTVDLVFTGVAPSTEDFEVTLAYDADARFAGWNLVGNPFAKTAYIADGRDFYTMNSAGTSFEPASNSHIEAMEGVFVIAATDGEKMYFTTTQPTEQGRGIVLNLGEGRQNIDRAIVRFGEGRTLPKLQLFEGSTKIYIPQEGKEYAVVRSEEMGEMPVNFKAENNGTFSLNVSGQNTEFAYLHLIDNLTGNDVDLLETPSYSFEAKTTDYASRFKLVYATGNASDDTFAFYSNGSFVINNEGNAELQVVDVMGRILSSETINGCANVSVNGAAGVYMLRLVNGDNVKVQKVVVK